MIAKRIIPCLDVRAGAVVKGVRFRDHRVAGDILELAVRYRDEGALATIGRHSAIADLGWLKLTGFPAWVLWGVVHIFFLIGFRNRMAVFLNWIWAWLTYGRGARLITGDTTRLALTPKLAPTAIVEDLVSEGASDHHRTKSPL